MFLSCLGWVINDWSWLEKVDFKLRLNKKNIKVITFGKMNKNISEVNKVIFNKSMFFWFTSNNDLPIFLRLNRCWPTLNGASTEEALGIRHRSTIASLCGCGRGVLKWGKTKNWAWGLELRIYTSYINIYIYLYLFLYIEWESSFYMLYIYIVFMYIS